MAKSPHTPEWRAMVAKEYLDGKASSPDIAKKYGINDRTVRRWAQRYQEQGIAAFERGSGNTAYTAGVFSETQILLFFSILLFPKSNFYVL